MMRGVAAIVWRFCAGLSPRVPISESHANPCSEAERERPGLFFYC